MTTVRVDEPEDVVVIDEDGTVAHDVEGKEEGKKDALSTDEQVQAGDAAESTDTPPTDVE